MNRPPLDMQALVPRRPAFWRRHWRAWLVLAALAAWLAATGQLPAILGFVCG